MEEDATREVKRIKTEQKIEVSTSIAPTQVPLATPTTTDTVMTEHVPIIDPFATRANDVIFFKSVHNKEDFDNPTTSFNPKFTHQIFSEDEKINGYTNLHVDYFFSPAATQYYLSTSHSEKKSDADDIPALISKHMSHPPSSTASDFLSLTATELTTFKPPGHLAHTYTHNATTYEIYKGNIVGDKIQDYHKKIQHFVLYFIDASSFIDDTDPSWDIYFVFEKKEYYSLVGYCTLYSFYAYPNRSRKRISQFLILPQFQRQGHGQHLLNAMYKDFRVDSVKDVTVESPSEEFCHLRDIVDCLILQDTDFPDEVDFKDLDDEVVDEIYNKYKIPVEQIKRCREIFLLASVDESNVEELRKYRLLVKRSLFKKNQEILGAIEDEKERKRELQKIFEEELKGYKSVLKRLKKN